MARARYLGANGKVEHVDREPLLRAMRALADEIGRINLQLPIRSPSRAGLKAITRQMDEVATLLTGDPDYLRGKPHGWMR